MKVWIVDAFTDVPYAGNPAGVAMVDEFPSDDICQKIAAEINLSETAFVKHLENNHYHIRWFTPKVEAKLCGHATLASAHILKKKEILFESLSGPLKVNASPPDITLDFPLQPHPGEDKIVELSTEEEVRLFQPNFEEIFKMECRALIITAKGKPPYDFVSRFFAPKVGINEDPVTGSAHCKLAFYWQQKLHKSAFLAYQASSRGGTIALKIVHDRVLLTGQAVTICESHWLV